jgi:hypothetical protein
MLSSLGRDPFRIAATLFFSFWLTAKNKLVSLNIAPVDFANQ